MDGAGSSLPCDVGLSFSLGCLPRRQLSGELRGSHGVEPSLVGSRKGRDWCYKARHCSPPHSGTLLPRAGMSIPVCLGTPGVGVRVLGRAGIPDAADVGPARGVRDPQVCRGISEKL